MFDIQFTSMLKDTVIVIIMVLLSKGCLEAVFYRTIGLWLYLVEMILVDGDKGIAFMPHSGCQISSK